MCFQTTSPANKSCCHADGMAAQVANVRPTAGVGAELDLSAGAVLPVPPVSPAVLLLVAGAAYIYFVKRRR